MRNTFLGFQYEASAMIMLDAESVRTLCEKANKHYDHECRNAAHRDGFLHKWLLLFQPELPEAEMTIEVFFRQSDLLAKICEHDGGDQLKFFSDLTKRIQGETERVIRTAKKKK